MYFWYGNNDGSSRTYGAELGFYELNANQIKNYVVDNDPNIELIKSSLFENIDEAEEEEEIINGKIPSENTIEIYSTEQVSGPFLEKNYGISISSSIDEINSKVISEYPSETFKINDYIDFMSGGGKYWIAWEKGLKWGPIQLKSDLIKKDSFFEIECERFNNSTIMTRLIVEDEEIEEFQEAYMDAEESISGTSFYLVSFCGEEPKITDL